MNLKSGEFDDSLVIEYQYKKIAFVPSTFHRYSD